jgi:hypothetical protein
MKAKKVNESIKHLTGRTPEEIQEFKIEFKDNIIKMLVDFYTDSVDEIPLRQVRLALGETMEEDIENAFGDIIGDGEVKDILSRSDLKQIKDAVIEKLRDYKKEQREQDLKDRDEFWS